MRNLLVLVLLGAMLGMAALMARAGLLDRGQDGRTMTPVANTRNAKKWSEADEKLIAEKYPQAQKTESGMYYIVHSPGEGPCPGYGDRVTVHYEGRFLDGQKFDSSYDRKEPFTFTVGVGKVIKGWDEAFLTMKKGEKRTLIVPHWLAYGDKARPSIPPRSTLVFEVELLSFR